ncbi:MAG TPA: hypothetical protein VMC84_03360 [Methanocella sp.]|uniref:hypothetical protein n=1 Tax=Methanocella sp. TaxID=2052833 RepID=UPI002CDD3085|nr:hypothetical protein [Methanocella sp.]HTY90192.1 hypothetical protein [Methanocella sp.]
MGLCFYRRLKAPAILFTVLLLAWLISVQAQPADARANLTAYTTATPNSWQMKGFNVSGTAPQFIRDTYGWNDSKMLGNVGLGNGSLNDLNASSNRVIDYNEQYSMAADISEAPFNKSRLTSVSLNGTGLEPGYKSNVSEARYEGQENNTIRLTSMDEDLGQPESAPDKATGQEAAQVAIGENIPLNDPYHTFLIGRPVDDMIYEHPHGIATNAYGRLMGLPLPGGSSANIGIRLLGYGY